MFVRFVRCDLCEKVAESKDDAPCPTGWHITVNMNRHACKDCVQHIIDAVDEEKNQAMAAVEVDAAKFRADLAAGAAGFSHEYVAKIAEQHRQKQKGVIDGIPLADKMRKS